MKTFALCLLAVSMAFAQDAPKPHSIDFSAAITDLDGKSVPNPDPKGWKPYLTLSDVTATALEANLDEDKSETTGVPKYERDNLTRKIYKQTKVVLTAEQITLIKERIGKAWGSLVVGAAWRLLDPAVAEK
jgi:hypothetical protein